MPVVMGTAGHIDHGKTSLIRALTGMDCDRLIEEKKRGITIELGFAFLDLPDHKRVSVIDVPGHERFVKNMVAGTAGIDFVMLVIAADEGVMPQTCEHLEICTLLGIKKGLVALTKTDMVDDDWLAFVTEDIAQFLKGSFLEGAAIYPVSSHTGRGLDELKQALGEMSTTYMPKRRGDLPRLPVDRVFTIRGYGTIVTGTLISGHFSQGDTLVLLPSGKSSKARVLQSHGASVDVAPAGFRTAVNLPMLEVAEIERGEVLTLPGRLFPALEWIIRVRCLASSPRPLRHRMEVHFHHGAREAQARLYFFDRERLQPGEEALCRVHFESPMVGVAGDRFVLRTFSPLRTVAGGEVLHPLPLVVRRRDKNFARKTALLESLNEAGEADDPTNVVLAQAALAGEDGVTFAEICVLVNAESSRLDKVVQQLCASQKLFVVDREERRFIAEEHVAALSESCLEWFAEFHRREPLRTGMSRNAVLSGWGKGLRPKLVYFILKRLTDQGKIVVEGDELKAASHTVALDSGSGDLRDYLLSAYTRAGITPPNFNEVLEERGLTARQVQPVLKLLLDSGELVRVTESIYYAAPALSQIKEAVRQWFAEHGGITPADLREATGLSRKYGIALLEYFDRVKFTLRTGDKRILRDGKA